MGLLRAVAFGLLLTAFAVPLGATVGAVAVVLYWLDTLNFYGSRASGGKD